MRDLAVFVFIFGSIPFILKRPVVGVLMFTWISLMNPHRLTYGAAYDFPFAALIALLTLFSMLASNQPKHLPRTPVTILLIVFMTWMTITSFFALEPDLAWKEWNRVFKTYLMIVVVMLVLHTEKDIKLLAWVTGPSLIEHWRSLASARMRSVSRLSTCCKIMSGTSVTPCCTCPCRAGCLHSRSEARRRDGDSVDDLAVSL